MANVGTGSIRLIDSDGDAIDSGGALKVQLIDSGDSIDIGNVDLMLDGGVPLLGNTGSIAAGVLRVTIADDDNVSTKLTSIDTDTGNIYSILSGVIGSDGGTGPAKVMSIGGTVSIGGAIQELQCDANGILMVEAIDGGNSLTVDNAGTFATQIDGAALTALEKIDDIQDTIGTDGNTGPSKAISIAGTQSGGNLQEVEVDSSGRISVNVKDFDVAAGGGATDIIKADSEGYDTGSVGIMNKVVCSDALATLTNVTNGEITSLQVNTQGALYTTHGITGGADGTKVVTTAGTDVALALSTACKKVDIQAYTLNTGLIAVGFTGVDATEANGTGVILRAGDTYSLETDNLLDIYIDATVDGEGVRYTYFT
jgi:hypothetical protein